MAKQTINIGSSVNKGDGDPLRTAFDKINDNFDELYASSDSQTLTLVGNTLTISNGNSVEINGLTQDFAFSSLTGTPTTLAGYGITDSLAAGSAFDVQGSVFADDSTLLVDSVNSKIVGNIETTKLNIPPQSEPNLYGQASDTPGDVVFTTTYLYYCTRVFPRQADYSATVIAATNNDFRVDVNFVDFPTDIYDGFEMYEADGITLVGVVETISESLSVDIGKTIVRMVTFASPQSAGSTVILRYTTNAKIWKRVALT